MTREEFDKSFEGVSVVSVKKVTTYRAGAIVALLLLLGVLVATYIYFVIPLHKIYLTIAFIGGIIAGIYNLSVELLSPGQHLHWHFKLPNNFQGWQVLYLISKCIKYIPTENLLVLQFNDEVEPQLAKVLLDLIKTQESQD